MVSRLGPGAKTGPSARAARPVHDEEMSADASHDDANANASVDARESDIELTSGSEHGARHAGGGRTADSTEDDSVPSDFMADFFATTNTIKSDLATLDSTTTELEAQHGAALAATSSKARARAATQISELRERIDSLLRTTTNRLTALARENAAVAAKGNADSTEMRIRANAHAALTRKLEAELTRYRASLEDYRNHSRRIADQQLRIVKPDATDDEIRAFSEGGDGDAASPFLVGITGTAALTAARSALQNASERHDALLEVEAALNELNQLFIDISLLVAERSYVCAMFANRPNVRLASLCPSLRQRVP
eukprot:c5909_g1_i2.p1 GENE.c5909_g1_i2~~c5909_g1_i2.p1  ORF type:complete len:312 (-),score=58.51 c5909_g1_i2:286-1221(-)